MSLRILALGLVAVALVVVPTPGAAAVRQLERAAKEWESRGREDKAAEAWERILGLQANHPDALRGVGLARAAEGRTAEAERYLRRLEQAAPQHEGVGQIRQRLALGPRHRSLLTDARLHAQTGRKAEALETYRQLFGPAPPPPALALEYYRTVGGDEEGWEEARRGLEATVRRWPSPRHRLALAEHLTYRPETREQGVAMLRELVDDDDVGPSAKSAWRQSLDWLGASPGELAMIAAYEERYPEDGPVRSAPAEGQARGGSGSGVDRALLAQGLQALEEGRFTDAIGIFERVRRSAPDEPAVWARPLRSARFWDGMQRAQAARAEGNRERARETLVEIQAISRPEAAHAELVLAQIDQEEGELARAEARLLPLLGNPEVQIPALETLIGILAQMGREEEARQRQAELAALDEERALDPRWEAELLRHRARTAMDAGDLEEAQAVLERAHTLDPNHVWVLHDLSTVALQQGRMEEANTWAAKLAARDPDLPEARLLSARILVAEGDPEGALAVLAPLEDDPAVARERHHIALLAELGRAQALYERGDERQARRSLLLLQGEVRMDPERLALVAQSWSQLGEHERAVHLIDDAMARAVRPSPQLRLRAASIYLQSGRGEKAMSLVRELESEPLSPEDRAWLRDLRIGHAIQRSDELRRDGRFSAAFRQIESPLRLDPDEPLLLAALGRIFHDNGDIEEAYASYRAALRERPTLLEARQGAIQTAAELNRKDEVRELVREGIELHPRSPRMRLVAGNALVSIGDRSEGSRQLREGLRLAEGMRDREPRRAEGEASSRDLIQLASYRLASSAADEGKSSGDVVAELRDALSLADASRSVLLGGSGFVRYRSGEEGLGRLLEMRAPLQIAAPLGYDGRLRLEVIPIALSAGDLQMQDPRIARSFGIADARFADREGIGPFSRNASGLALSLGLQTDGLWLDVGSTPFGFHHTTWTAGLLWEDSWEAIGVRAIVERRRVTDSLLSYAGTTRVDDGASWGGVNRNGGQVSLSFDLRPTTFYLYGGFDYLEGVRVATNHRFEGGGGIDWTIREGRRGSLGSGIGVDFFGFDKNLRYFTWGHGGYFSPQAFWHVGVPLRWRGGTSKVAWDLYGDIGVIWFREDGTPAFPTEPLRQAADPLFFEGKDVVSLALNATPRLFVLLSERVNAGLLGDVHAARDYTEVGGGLFVEILLDGRSEVRGSGWYRRLGRLR